MSEPVRASSHEVPVAGTIEFFQHGWHSWCETRWLDPATSPQPVPDRVDRLGHADPLHAFDTVHGGAGVGAVIDGDGQVTLLGALSGGAWVHCDGRRLIGTYEEGDGPWVELEGTELEVFGRYAELVADNQGRRGGDGMRLWSSWYSHYEDVTEAIVDDTIAGLAGLEFDVIQVDDGWQQAIGDWGPNAKFPSGMAAVAERIQGAGRKAGLWLAPFIAMPGSQFAEQRRQLILDDAEGQPVVAGHNWGGPYWALDVTRPDTLDYLTELFGGLSADGYEFFKLDFIYAAALPGVTSASRSDAYRNACERIREAVGDATYLLACGAPIIESIGVFDGIRIGPDVGPSWSDGTYAAAAPAMTTSAHRLWLGAAIDTDPDVVYFRDTGLSDGTKQHLEAMAQISGFKGTSDPPGSLETQQRDALAAFLTTTPSVEQVGRYRWHLDGEEVDFGPAIGAGEREPDWAGVT